MQAPPTLRRLLGIALATLVPLAAPADPDAIAAADAAWERRAEGALDGQPRPGPIEASIRGYQQLLERDPGHLEARWKLLRSLHFAGEFLETGEEQKRARFERATELSEQGLERLAPRLRPAALDDLDALEAGKIAHGAPDVAMAPSDHHDVARLYFWSAIHWGAWSRTVGLLSAVREGVANRLHRYTRVALALEPGYDDGGPYRLLGRLHAVLPRVPLLSGWVDRDRALPLIEQAQELAPAHPGNRLLLALTLLDLAPERPEEAVALLGEVAALEPRPAMRVEDLRIRAQARQRLSELGEET